MNLKEGRCPNCGSILSLDPKSEKGHCLFCDAVFDNARAFEIMENPEGVEFPNEAQPEYEGPNLDPVFNNAPASARTVSKATSRTSSSRRKPVEAEKYVHKDPIELPEIKLSNRVRVQIVLVALLLVAIIAAISIPLLTKREADREQILNDFSSIASYKVEPNKSLLVRNIANNYALIALDEDVDPTAAGLLYKEFCQTRAEVRKADTNDFDKMYGRVTVKIVMPKGGYLIKPPADLAALESGSNITTIE